MPQVNEFSWLTLSYMMVFCFVIFFVSFNFFYMKNKVFHLYKNYFFFTYLI